MLILDTSLLLRRYVRRWLLVNRRIALVPAHSPVHQGHLALIAQARACADIVVVALLPELSRSNAETPPAASSPLQQDCELLSQVQVDLLFVPGRPFLAPQSATTGTLVQPSAVASAVTPPQDFDHYTIFNPTCFTTTLCKLLNLLQADLLCLGQKNYLQLRISQQVVQDLNYSTQIVVVPTARDSDGLPYTRHHPALTEEMRTTLRRFKQQLDWLVQQLEQGERQFAQLLEQSCHRLEEAGLTVTQALIRDADTLQEVTIDSQHAIILLTAQLLERSFSDNAIVNLHD